jgi:hypothetical protein
MVLAFQALGYLAGQRIRPGRFHKLGGLPGLEALPLDHEIEEASRHSGCGRDLIRQALAELVDEHDHTKTRVVAFVNIASKLGCNEREAANLRRAFEVGWICCLSHEET